MGQPHHNGYRSVDTGSDGKSSSRSSANGKYGNPSDRDLDQAVFLPSISQRTRKEELRITPGIGKGVWIGPCYAGVPGVEAMEMLIKRLKATKSNAEFLMSLK